MECVLTLRPDVSFEFQHYVCNEHKYEYPTDYGHESHVHRWVLDT